jgi:hypothetical protein
VYIVEADMGKQKIIIRMQAFSNTMIAKNENLTKVKGTHHKQPAYKLLVRYYPTLGR